MKIIRREENRVKLKTEVPEDLWHLVKVIKPGDLVSGSSYRKFTTDSGNTERKRVFITVKCEKTEFHKGYDKLRVLGKITAGKPEEFVAVGSHHSLDFDVQDEITIQKFKWMQYEWDRIKEAEKAVKNVKMSALIIDERDAEFFAIREYGITELGAVSLSGSGKYKDESKDAKNKFYTEIYDLMKTTDGKIIIAGPGFEKENFTKFLKDKDAKLSKNIFTESIGNTGKQGVFELIKNESVSRIFQESRFNDEVKAVEEIISKLHTDYVVYGINEVDEALDFGAVEKLIVLDELAFENKKIEKLIDKAEKTRTKIMMVSSENEISEKLKGISGIAAILRFKIN